MRGSLLRIGVLMAALAGSIGVLAAAGSADSQPTFSSSFDTAADLNLFDWQIMHGGTNPFPNDDPASWQGDHDVNCGGPTTSRTVVHVPTAGPGAPSLIGDELWWCGAPGMDPHVMTSLVTHGYAHIDFSPHQTFTNVTKVCWDQNQTEMGGRKWTQMAVIPDGLFQQNGGRLDYVEEDLQNTVAIGGVPVTGTGWLLSTLKQTDKVQVGQQVTHTDFNFFSSADKATRYTQCATDMGNGTVKLEFNRPGGVSTRIAPGSFPTGPAHVIFQDVTYNSPKGDLGEAGALLVNTWHWDNIQVFAGGATPPPTTTTVAPTTTLPPTTTVPPTTTTVAPTTTLPPTTTTTVVPTTTTSPACPPDFSTPQLSWCVKVNARLHALDGS